MQFEIVGDELRVSRYNPYNVVLPAAGRAVISGKTIRITVADATFRDIQRLLATLRARNVRAHYRVLKEDDKVIAYVVWGDVATEGQKFYPSRPKKVKEVKTK